MQKVLNEFYKQNEIEKDNVVSISSRDREMTNMIKSLTTHQKSKI